MKSKTYGKIYSDKVLEHVANPKNMREMKNPSATATVGNPVCGDVMKFYLRIGKRSGEEYIKDVKFQTLGCGAAIASSSMYTTLVKGKFVKDALKVTKQDVIDSLDGLPPSKVHCSILADKGLKKAIENFRNSHD